MKRKTLAIASFLGASVLAAVTVAGAKSDDPAFLIAAEAPWIHYSSIDPTASEPGIKEYYVNCATTEHRFTQPSASITEGQWTNDKKEVIKADPNDDRYIKSFNELDSMIEGYRGTGAFDYVHIKEAKDYYDTNYSSAAKTNYVASSNAIFEAKETYDDLYSVIYNAKTLKTSASSSTGVFTYSQEEDDLYGGVTTLEFVVDVTPGSSYANKDMAWYAQEGQLSPVSASNKTISFAIYASEECSFNIVAVYDDTWRQNTIFSKSLNVGWNEYTFDSTFPTYQYLTNAETLKCIQLQIGSSHSRGSVIKVSSFIGLSSVKSVEKKIDALPSISDLDSKDYDAIKSAKDAYDSLSDADKGKVSNYSKLNALYRSWNSKYVLLYDVSASYAGFTTFGGGALSQSLVYDEAYGYSKAVTVVEGFQALFLSGYKEAYTNIELSEIVYYVKPSRDTYMSWTNNYGRRDGDPITHGGQWNRYSVSGSLTVNSEEKDAVEVFMDMFNTGPYSVINMTGAASRWNDYCLNDVGYSFQMTSLVGVRKLTTIEELNKKIAALPSLGTVTLEDVSSLSQIEEEYETLTSFEKASVVGMDKYYDVKSEYNRKYSYIIDPATDISSWQEPGNISSHEVQVYEKYGPCYLFHVTKNTGATMLLKPSTISTEATGAKLYTKNYGNKLDFCVGSHEDVVVSKTSGSSLGDGWYEYTFTKSEINAMMDYQNYPGKILYYMVPGGSDNTPLLGGTEFYMSGLFGTYDTSYDASSVASIQEKIDALPSESELTPFSNVELSSLQDEIYSLSPMGQRALRGAEQVTNLYSAYKERYEFAYSLEAYRYGLIWYSCAKNITPTNDSTYGKVTSFDTVGGKVANISLGSWIKANNYASNSYSGQGRPISPLEHGKFKNLYFSVYSPLPERTYLHVYTAKEKTSTETAVQSFYVYPGWNTMTFSQESIEKLSGYVGGSYSDFQGLDIAINSQTSDYSGWKFTGFIGEKNPNYAGDPKMHYASDTLHENVDNIRSSSTPLFEAGSSTYRFVYNEGGIADKAVSFLKKTLNEQTGVIPSFVSHSSFNEKGRYIYIDSPSEMEEAGVPLPSKDSIGETGYMIRTVGESVFIYAYGADGYRMGILKFLEGSIGYEWLSHDLSINEKNGSLASALSTYYLPLFDVLERPDYDARIFSNNTRATDPNGIYGSGLGGYQYYLMDDGNGNRIGDMADYLPYDDYSDYYYSDSKGKSFCYSCKGSSTKMDAAIKIVGDKIISGAIAHPEINYAAAFQVDSGNHCTCSGCKALYGSDYDMYASVEINFMNKLDNYIKANYTARTIKLLFLAYSFNYTLKVPTNIEINKDVIPFIAATRARWCYSFYDDENSTAAGEADSKGNVYQYDNDFAGIIEEWNAYASEIAIWAYQTSFGSSLLVYNTFDTMMDQYRFFYNNGARFMLNEGNWVDNSSGFTALKDYMDSRALNNVNESYDDMYATFFRYYYGNAADAMRNIFDEAINNFNYCLDRYGRGADYNPDNSKVYDGTNYYFDGRLEINAGYDYSYFWGDDGKNLNYVDVYNGQQNLGATNIANITKWLEYVETALTSETRETYQKHIKNDALMVYLLAYEHKGRTDLKETIVETSYEVGTYWFGEMGPRSDGYVWKTGTHTICYELTGKTYQEYFGL